MRSRRKADATARHLERADDIYSPPPRRSRAGLRPNLTDDEAMHRALHLADDPATTEEDPFQVHLQLTRIRRMLDRIVFRDQARLDEAEQILIKSLRAIIFRCLNDGSIFSKFPS